MPHRGFNIVNIGAIHVMTLDIFGTQGIRRMHAGALKISKLNEFCILLIHLLRLKQVVYIIYIY